MSDSEIMLESSYSVIRMLRCNMLYVQVYTGVPGSVAIEPMSGAPDVYHNELGALRNKT